MFWRTCYLYVLTVGYVQSFVEVACSTVSISIVAIEADAFQCWSDESEVALISSLYTEYASIVSIDVLPYLERFVGILTCKTEVFTQILV